ncbi:retron system putative HNH endonuclease [Candidatus Symbiobacter mobilis]|uniref:TIGR02646 family protein n=1 Tax=Candidatus Symbiobacter mobilis CR TaxID=946483 RepID=U5NB28_9BURK|nr:retron system putative HNH endonuclease [Candidatus Symbiobacter mobilis]AGX87364.1 hypothetical protein Cenrod_1272 [Candidatus Symbiobacter mobilis CR]
MRRLQRADLPKPIWTYLEKRQSSANQKYSLGTLDIEKEWKSARQTQCLKAVLATLQQMMGTRERCMYCVDSHGSDIEHFRPKMPYPQHAFQWPNLLLCCTECGRLTGSQFPMHQGQPLLIDPCAEDPWQYLDFDPDTGNLTARFDPQQNEWSTKGSKTVEVLMLDQREAVAAGYQTSFQRLSAIVRAALANGVSDAPALFDELTQADDHGLLGWCFGTTGQTIAPFSDLFQRHLEAWNFCRQSL